jgi:hypothetical protein
VCFRNFKKDPREHEKKESFKNIVVDLRILGRWSIHTGDAHMCIFQHFLEAQNSKI